MNDSSHIHDVMDNSTGSVDAKAASMDWDPHIRVLPEHKFLQSASVRALQSILAMRGLVLVTWEC